MPVPDRTITIVTVSTQVDVSLFKPHTMRHDTNFLLSDLESCQIDILKRLKMAEDENKYQIKKKMREELS